MTAPGTNPGTGPAEATGLATAQAYAAGMSQAFTSAASGAETFAAGLDGHGVDGPAVAAVVRAQELTSQAGTAWQQASGALDKQTVVKEAYAVAPEAGSKQFVTDTTSGPGPQQTTAGTTTTPGDGGHYNPDQPRAADGKWVKIGDVLGYADGENCHGTDQVLGDGPVPTTLALIEYPDDGINQKGAFVEVATSKSGYNPTTGQEADGTSYCPPQLGPDEADSAAGRLEELAAMVESGYRPPAPTKHTRARQRMELLLQEDRADRRDRITVGEEDEFPLTTGDLLKLLIEADPTLSSPQTRHAVRAHAAMAGGGEDGTLWLDIEPDAAGDMHVMVTAVEGTESPEDNRQHAAQHTPDSARELAAKLRAFARGAQRRNTH